MADRRVWMITGASRGMGVSFCKAALAAGDAVVATGRRPDEIATVLGESDSLLAVKLDVTSVADPQAAAKAAVERFGRIDVLVNNAGITRDRSLAKMSQDEWDDVIQTNLSSVFHMTARVLPQMVEAGYGRIISISSVVGLHGNYGQANYAAAKAGIVGFTKTAALELARKGVTVNAIAPGFIATQMIAAMPDEVRDRILEKIPMGRFGRPEEIAELVAFLVTKGEYITGQVIAIDGGLYT